QAIDGHAPELASNIPQRHVDRGQRVDHERPAAHVAVRTEDLLPEMLDARGVFAVEELKERLGQRDGHRWIEPGDFTPAGNLVVGLDLEIRLGADDKAL